MTGTGHAPRVLFLGLAYAGHRTRFANLRDHTADDPRIRATYQAVTGWDEQGRIERLPCISKAIKGRVRAVLQAAPMAALPRPDVIWSSVGQVAVPHLWAELGNLRRPRIQDLDSTLEQLEQLAPLYYGRPPHAGARGVFGRLVERAMLRNVTLFTPWSRWAADGLRRRGVSNDRIRVLPPGVDLAQWQPRPELRPNSEGPLRLLFVGGDFVRKGGPLLLDLMRGQFAERCELDVVSRDPVPDVPGVRAHRVEANSPELRQLYARADLFVLPTQAECFGLATVEALACGLPVIMSNVGGAADIVDPGETGWLIEPTRAALGAALEQALARREQLPVIGRRGRQVAEERFDGRRNDAIIVDLVLEQAARHRGAA